MKRKKFDSEKDAASPKHVLNGIAWGFLGRIALGLLQFIFIIVLANGATPNQFSGAVILLIINQVITTICSNSVAQGLVHRGDSGEVVRSTGFWINTLVCLIFFGLIYTFSTEICRWLDLGLEPYMVSTISFGALISIPKVLPMAELSAGLAFRRIVLTETGAGVVAYTLAITSVFLGFGIVTVLLLCLSRQLMEVAFYCLQHRWWPTFDFSLEESRKIFRFSMPLIIWQLVGILNNSLDQLFVARNLGAESLGFYGFGKRITEQPAKMLSSTVARTLFPALVKVRNEDRNSSTLYILMARYISFASFSVFMFVASFSEELVMLALGDNWRESIPIVTALCFSAALAPIFGGFSSLLRSAGRTTWQLGLSLLRLALVAGIMSVAIFYFKLSAVQAAWTMVGISFFMLMPNAACAHSAGNISNITFLIAIFRGILPAVLAASVVYLVGLYTGDLCCRGEMDLLLLLRVFVFVFVLGVVAIMLNSEIILLIRNRVRGH